MSNEVLADALVKSENDNARLRMVIRDILNGNAKQRIKGTFQNALVHGFENDERCEEILKGPIDRVNAELNAIYAQLRAALNVGAVATGTISEIEFVCVDTFALSERRSIEQFRHFWNEGRTANPDDFPEKMPLGEWDDQYRGWAS